MEPIGEELALSRKAGISLEEGDALNLQGQALAGIGDTAKAREALMEAVAVRHRMGASTEAQSLLDLARLEGDSGAPGTALEYARKALDLVESLRSNVGSHASRMRIASTHRAYYDLAIELAMRTGDEAEALAIAERGKARSLIDFLAEARVDLNHGVEPQLTVKERRSKNFSMPGMSGSCVCSSRPTLRREKRRRGGMWTRLSTPTRRFRVRSG